MFRNFQVQWCRTFSDTTGSIVMRPVAGAVVASKITRVGDGNTPQMGAYSKNNQPFRVLYSIVVVLWISESIYSNTLFSRYFCTCPVSYKKWFSFKKKYSIIILICFLILSYYVHFQCENFGKCKNKWGIPMSISIFSNLLKSFMNNQQE